MIFMAAGVILGGGEVEGCGTAKAVGVHFCRYWTGTSEVVGILRSLVCFADTIEDESGDVVFDRFVIPRAAGMNLVWRGAFPIGPLPRHNTCPKKLTKIP